MSTPTDVLWLPSGKPTLIGMTRDMWDAFHRAMRDRRPIAMQLRLPLPASPVVGPDTPETETMRVVTIRAEPPHSSYHGITPPLVPTLNSDGDVRAVIAWLGELYK